MHPSGPDTTLGGAKRDFPNTRWSLLLGGLRGEGDWADLARLYWKPIYAYLRAKWAKSNEEAKDLTQDFFCWLLESDFLSKADPERGRFRAFVKVALKRYLQHDEERQGRQKRGGGVRILALEEKSGNLTLPDPGARSPEEALDDAWRKELFDRAAERLEETLKRDGREVVFRVFRDYHLKESGELNYRDLAARYRISEVDVSNHLADAKRRLRSILMDFVAETVQGEAELRDELKALFGGMSP